MITNATYSRSVPREKYGGSESLTVEVSAEEGRPIEECIEEASAFVKKRLWILTSPANPDINPPNEAAPTDSGRNPPKDLPASVSDPAPPQNISEEFRTIQTALQRLDKFMDRDEKTVQEFDDFTLSIQKEYGKGVWNLVEPTRNKRLLDIFGEDRAKVMNQNKKSQ